MRSESLVDENGFRITDESDRGGGDPPFLRDPAGGAHCEIGFKFGGFHRVRTAMRTPKETVPFEQPQIATNGLGRNGQLGGQLGDVDFALPSRQGDNLMLPFVCIQLAPPAAQYKRFPPRLPWTICNTGETSGPHHSLGKLGGSLPVLLQRWTARYPIREVRTRTNVMPE